MNQDTKQIESKPLPAPAGSEPWLTRYTVLSSPPTCEINGMLLREAMVTAEYRLQGCAKKVLITVEPNK